MIATAASPSDPALLPEVAVLVPLLLVPVLLLPVLLLEEPPPINVMLSMVNDPVAGPSVRSITMPWN